MANTSEAFQSSRYEKTVRDIKVLKSLLPEEAVIALAREVLLRVAESATLKGATHSPAPDAEVAELARALMSSDPNAGANFVSRLRAKGVSDDRVYLSYLADAARKLGDWWTTDEASLLDVTVGTGRIYAIMRAMADGFDAPKALKEKTAIFAAAPDETHTLGVKMAADLFRKDGWEIDLKVGLSHEALVEAIRQTSHVIIGLSGGGAHSVTILARLVVALRISNPKALIIISGQVVNEASELVARMDIDAMAGDFQTAVSEMDRLWKLTQESR